MRGADLNNEPLKGTSIKRCRTTCASRRSKRTLFIAIEFQNLDILLLYSTPSGWSQTNFGKRTLLPTGSCCRTSWNFPLSWNWYRNLRAASGLRGCSTRFLCVLSEMPQVV